MIEAAARERGALVLDLRDFGARNLVMTDHVHPTAFGQVWIAERALDVLAADGMDVRVRPSTLIRPSDAHPHAAPAGRLDLRLPAAQGAGSGSARVPRVGRAELREPPRHVAVAEEQQQPERRPAHSDRGGGEPADPARRDQDRVDGGAQPEQRRPGERVARSSRAAPRAASPSPARRGRARRR